ncbi:MAG: hypothetical protein R3B93_09340 [Bacteroidia bacterium]
MGVSLILTPNPDLDGTALNDVAAWESFLNTYASDDDFDLEICTIQQLTRKPTKAHIDPRIFKRISVQAGPNDVIFLFRRTWIKRKNRHSGF